MAAYFRLSIRTNRLGKPREGLCSSSIGLTGPIENRTVRGPLAPEAATRSLRDVRDTATRVRVRELEPKQKRRRHR